MSDWLDFFVILGMFVVLAGIVIGLLYAIEIKQCYSKYNDFQPEYIGIITGCVVQYNGKRVPVESLRVMD